MMLRTFTAGTGEKLASKRLENPLSHSPLMTLDMSPGSCIWYHDNLRQATLPAKRLTANGVLWTTNAPLALQAQTQQELFRKAVRREAFSPL